jgi:nucleotide-binding universal stress UspA family protein
MFTKVVWATDGSAHADRALEYAKQLVQRDGGTLYVTHVVEKLVGPRVAGENANLNEPQIEDKIRSQAQAAARERLDVKVDVSAARAGEVARVIADAAASTGADVIVVGTRGHSAAVSAVIGSVTQRLLHIAGCPVLAVPPPRHGTDRFQPADSVAAG